MHQRMMVDMEIWSAFGKLMPGIWLTCKECGTAVRVPGKAFDIFGETVILPMPITPPGCARCNAWWDVRLINWRVNLYDATVLFHERRLRGF